jgi:uroporphyrinogen-III decarboxylase
MLRAISCQQPDYVPCCFMIFAALRSQCASPFGRVQRELELGLDATIHIMGGRELVNRADSHYADLQGFPVRFDPLVEVVDWQEDPPGGELPVLHREYRTPAGTLDTAVTKTDDWVQGDRVPLFDDYVVPRARKRLITGPDDLDALQYLLTDPSDADLADLRASAAQVKPFAQENGVLVKAGRGSVVDTACWLAGMTELVLLAIDQPGFVRDLFGLIERWNRKRMEALLDAGVDLFIRRAWYEGTDLWSPSLYRQFILPSVRRDADLVHQAGAKFGYILTSGQTPLLDMLIESGIDVLIGLDPVQGKGTDFRAIKRAVGDRICLWGGVNGFVTMETGSPDQVRAEVRTALDALAPGGGFILSPVDNVTTNTDRTWANIHTMIDEWRRGRAYG